MKVNPLKKKGLERINTQLGPSRLRSLGLWGEMGSVDAA